MPVVQSKVRSGLLQLQGAAANTWETFSCQPTAVAITPTNTEGTTGDELEVLCGDKIPGDATSEEKGATLDITAIQDFDDPNGLQRYAWVNDGQTRAFRWRPTADAQDLWEGTVRVRAIGVGGTVGERLDQTFSWTINSLKLPPRFGGGMFFGVQIAQAVSKASSTAVEPGFRFPADTGVTDIASLTTAGYAPASGHNAAWLPGESFAIGNTPELEAHWDGAAWLAGKA
jgi:hypothetical protein